MGHIHPVTDGDNKHFVIDPVTRSIANNTSKLTLTQKDHNSERYTFEIPQDVEGHDMSLCNKIQIHFINIDAKTREKKLGIYEVDDVKKATSETGEKILTFTWLISGAATECMGTLSFAVRFACVDEETSAVTYSWNTAIHSNINILESIYNSESIVDEYYDILQEWLNKIENSIPEVGENGNWFVNGKDTGTRAGGTPGSILVDQVLVNSDETGNTYKQTYSQPDGSELEVEFTANTGRESLGWCTYIYEYLEGDDILGTREIEGTYTNHFSRKPVKGETFLMGGTADSEHMTTLFMCKVIDMNEEITEDHPLPTLTYEAIGLLPILAPPGEQGKTGEQGIQGLPGKDGEPGRDALLSAYILEYQPGEALIGEHRTMENYLEYFNYRREPVEGELFMLLGRDITISEWGVFDVSAIFVAEVISVDPESNTLVYRTDSALPISGKQGEIGLSALSCGYVLDDLVDPESSDGEELYITTGTITQYNEYFNRDPQAGELFEMNARIVTEDSSRSFVLPCKIDTVDEETLTVTYSILDVVETTGEKGPKGDTVSSVLYYNGSKDFEGSVPEVTESGNNQLPRSGFSRQAIVVDEYFTLLASSTVNDMPRSWILNCRVRAVSSSTITYDITAVVETTGMQGAPGPSGISCNAQWNDDGNLEITSASDPVIISIDDLRGPQGETIKSINLKETDSATGDNIYTVTLTNDAVLDSTITAPKGAQGEPGLVIFPRFTVSETAPDSALYVNVIVPGSTASSAGISGLINLGSLAMVDYITANKYSQSRAFGWIKGIDGVTLDTTVELSAFFDGRRGSDGVNGEQGPRGYGISSISISEVI